jgi:general secretion pathway protein I
MLNMVMGIVYPTLKPMMEASIRRVTVTVRWKEGPNKREFPLVQYITNPQRGGFMTGPMGSAAPMGSTGVPVNNVTPGAGSFPTPPRLP